MAANTSPIFVLTGCIAGVVFTAANVKSDGAGTIGTDIFLVVTGSAEGTYINTIRISPVSSAAATATTATVLRVFLSTVASGATTSANTRLFREISAASQTAAHSTAAITGYEIPCGFILPFNHTILVTTHVIAATNTSWMALVMGGNY